MHNHCLLSKVSMSLLHDPADKNDPSPSIPIGNGECLEYILDRVTDNFSHGQVPLQCYHCRITIPQVQYHPNCLSCSTSVVDNAKIHLRQMLSLIQNIDPKNFLKMPGYTPQRYNVKLEYGNLVSILLSPHARHVAGLTRNAWVIKTNPGGAKMNELQPYPLR